MTARRLLLDQPLSGSGPDGPEPVPLGPWALPDAHPLGLTPWRGPYASVSDVEDAAARSLAWADRLLDGLVGPLEDSAGLGGMPRRFWEVYLLSTLGFLCGQLEDMRRRCAAVDGAGLRLGAPSGGAPDVLPDVEGLASSLVARTPLRHRLMEASARARFPGLPEDPVEYRRDSAPAPARRGPARAALSRAKQALELGLLRAAARDRVPGTWLWDSYRLDRGSRLALARAGLAPLSLPSPSAELPPADPALRARLFAAFPEPDRTALTLALPRCFVEGLSASVAAGRRLADALRPRPRRLITFGQAWSAPAPQRAALALLASSGTKVASVQHGGGYGGSYSCSPNASLEYRLADEFLTWGWGREDEPLAAADTFVPLPSVMLSPLRAAPAAPPRWKVLILVHTDAVCTRWLYTSLFPDFAADYFAREKVLLDSFKDLPGTAVKLNPIEYGWRQNAWVEADYAGFDVLRDGGFPDLARRAELCVTDYNSTAFHELLAAGRPFLATWDRRWFHGAPSFESALEGLRAVGVFHDRPEALAAAYRSAAGRVAAWWSEPARAAAVRAAAERFAAVSDDAPARLAGWARSVAPSGLL